MKQLSPLVRQVQHFNLSPTWSWTFTKEEVTDFCLQEVPFWSSAAFLWTLFDLFFIFIVHNYSSVNLF